jgi:hypothetical protein
LVHLLIESMGNRLAPEQPQRVAVGRRSVDWDSGAAVAHTDSM